MKYALIAASLMLATSASAASQLHCGKHSIIHWWGECRQGERQTPAPSPHANGIPTKPGKTGNPGVETPGVPPEHKPSGKPSTHTHGTGGTPGTHGNPGDDNPGTPPSDDDDGGTPTPGTHHGKGKHKNNGFGNGDQDAPGNSLNHNNAENSQHPHGHNN